MEDTKVNIIGADGHTVGIPLSLETYKMASDAGLTVGQYLNLKYPTNAEVHGTAFEQAMESTGMYLSEDRTYGRRPPKLSDVLSGKAQLDGGVITRPDGANSRTPAGRLLFPAVLLETLDSVLRDNREGYISSWLSMVATTESIDRPKYEQVIIDHGPSRAAVAQPISQLSRPVRMLTLRTSDITRTIPTYAIGLEISEEAIASASLNLVALAIREHALEERAASIDRDMVAMVDGDTDSNQAALASITAQSLDSAITVAGTLTQKAWIKYLRRNWRRCTKTHIICDMDTYLAIEGRANRPVKEHDAGQDERMNTVPRVILPGIPAGIPIFITETSLLGANTLVGLDASKSIRHVIYTGAAYQAVENFVMRRSLAMRMDWAERYERLGYDQSWDKMTLTV